MFGVLCWGSALRFVDQSEDLVEIGRWEIRFRESVNILDLPVHGGEVTIEEADKVAEPGLVRDEVVLGLHLKHVAHELLSYSLKDTDVRLRCKFHLAPVERPIRDDVLFVSHVSICSPKVSLHSRENRMPGNF